MKNYGGIRMTTEKDVLDEIAALIDVPDVATDVKSLALQIIEVKLLCKIASLLEDIKEAK